MDEMMIENSLSRERLYANYDWVSKKKEPQHMWCQIGLWRWGVVFLASFSIEDYIKVQSKCSHKNKRLQFPDFSYWMTEKLEIFPLKSAFFFHRLKFVHWTDHRILWCKVGKRIRFQRDQTGHCSRKSQSRNARAVINHITRNDRKMRVITKWGFFNKRAWFLYFQVYIMLLVNSRSPKKR